MNVPPEPASFSDDDADADAACESLPWQIASARAAVAKHHARLIDQLDDLSAEPGDPAEKSGRTA